MVPGIAPTPFLSIPVPDTEPVVVVDEEEGKCVVKAIPEKWEILSPEAYHGVLGEILRVVELETEVHPAGVLLALLTLFGNSIGTGAWVTVGGRRHHPGVYAAICCRSAGGKGDAYAVTRYIIGKADLPYLVRAIAQGVGSGEGMVERVRDELETVDKKGNKV